MNSEIVQFIAKLIITFGITFGVLMLPWGFMEMDMFEDKDIKKHGVIVTIVGFVLILTACLVCSLFAPTDNKIKQFMFTDFNGNTGQSESCYEIKEKKYCVVEKKSNNEEIIKEVYAYCKNEDACNSTKNINKHAENDEVNVNKEQKYIYIKDNNIYESKECSNIDEVLYCKDNNNNLVIVEKYLEK